MNTTQEINTSVQQEHPVRRRLIWACIITFLLLILFAVVLAVGNPMWHKRIYMFQAHIYPKYHAGIIPPPHNYSGTWVGWHTDGRKHFAGIYRNGKRHGPYTHWSSTGKYHTTTQYINGKPTNYSSWHDQGHIAGKGAYRDGKAHDKWNNWTKEGNLESTKVYDQGKLISSIYWYPNGVKKAEREYENGILHGKMRTFRPDGSLKAEREYKNGQRINAQPANTAARENAAADL